MTSVGQETWSFLRVEAGSHSRLRDPCIAQRCGWTQALGAVKSLEVHPDSKEPLLHAVPVLVSARIAPMSRMENQPWHRKVFSERNPTHQRF